jgi:uncharacterized protein with PQ loop repeat
MEIYLENPKTGKEKKLKSGWSWTCFFFYFSGIPLFNRGLAVHGAVMLIFWLVMLATTTVQIHTFVINQNELPFMLADAIAFIMLLPWLFYAIKANKMGVKALLKQGWQISEQTDTKAKVWANNLA